MHSNTYIPLLFALVVLATPFSLSAGEGFYIAGSIGSASLDEDFDGLSLDESTTAFRLTGGWQANPYFALELGYQNFGDFKETFVIDGVPADIRLSADGYLFGTTGRYPVWGGLDVVGRVGFFFWDGAAEINSVSQADPGDTNLYFGLGLDYNFNDRFAITSDWTRYDLDGAESDVLSAGLQFRFR